MDNNRRSGIFRSVPSGDLLYGSVVAVSPGFWLVVTSDFFIRAQSRFGAAAVTSAQLEPERRLV